PLTLVSPGTTNSKTPQTISTTTPEFLWSGGLPNSRYGLYISAAPYGSENLVYSNITLTGTSFTIPQGFLISGKQYRWNMAIFDSNNQSGNFSPSFHFQVSAVIPPPLPTPIIQRYEEPAPVISQSLPAVIPPKQSRTIQFTGQNQIVISVMVGSATEVVFPAPITKIVPGCGEEEVSLEVASNRMWIKPLAPWEGIIFTLVGDVSYPVKISPGASPDVQVLIEGTGTITSSSPSGGLFSTNSITGYLKLLFLENAPEIIDVNKEVYKEKNFVIKFKKQLSWDIFTGYVGEIENLSKSLIVVPVEEIAVPGLIAISADKETLKPHEKTLCYFLFKRVE
ncbi:MAG: hypothetical protein Q7I94_00135, partial [Candidatus Contubernalis sp.]|nr:hypothetical protein [Candidatus Contubernalis sp.]